jgi:transcription antitermination factor NusG
MITDRINKYDGRPFSEDEMVKVISSALAGEKAEVVVTSVH